MNIKKIALLVAAVFAGPAFATNGMNMEGYGPIAASVGGASFAYDNGTAGMINNPATIGFMPANSSRLDIAIGGLHPDITTTPSAGGNSLTSASDAFFMPAMGFTKKHDRFAWGLGMMAQGGMGTEYANGNFWGTLLGFNMTTNAAAAPTAANTTAAQALRNFSEVGVMRVMAPLTYDVSDTVKIGGSIDYVQAGMDIQWLIDGAHFANMMGANSTFGSIPASTMRTALQNAVGAGNFTRVNWGYFDFVKGSKFSQAAKGKGWSGNLGFTAKLSPRVTIGGVYHPKTSLSDLKAESATVSFNVEGGGMGAGQTIPVSGKVWVRNFQWPETYGLGFAYDVTDQMTVMADYKRIGWAGVMRNFNMTFTADGTQGNAMAAGFAGTSLDMAFSQNWTNQNVFQIGMAYKTNDSVTLRFGSNIAKNPIPNSLLSPLFPATIRSHITGGLGVQVNKASSFDVSVTYAPKYTAANSWSSGGGADQTVSHSQTNWQAMFSYRF